MPAYDETLEAIKKRVNALYEIYMADPPGFRDTHPEIKFTVSNGQSPKAVALRAIANHVLKDNQEYYWTVVENISGDARFVITSHSTWG